MKSGKEKARREMERRVGRRGYVLPKKMGTFAKRNL